MDSTEIGTATSVMACLHGATIRDAEKKLIADCRTCVAGLNRTVERMAVDCIFAASTPLRAITNALAARLDFSRLMENQSIPIGFILRKQTNRGPNGAKNIRKE